MKFTVNQGQLETELSLAIGCAALKDQGSSPISKISLEASKSGQLLIKTTDTEIAYLAVIEADVQQPGSFMLEAKRFTDHIANQRGETVSFSQQGGKVAVRCGRNRSTMPIFDSGELPYIPEETAPLVSVPAGILASLVHRVGFAISSEDSRFTLTAAQLEISSSGLVSVATNGKTLSLANYASDIEAGNIKALIPKKAIAELIKIATKSGEESQVTLAVDDKKNLFFRIGNRVLWSRGVEVNFPKNYAGCFMAGPANKIVLRASEMKETLERVGNFADDESSAVGFVFAPEALTIKADSSNRGSSEETIDVAYEGPQVTVGLSSKLVMEFLRLAGDKQIELTFRDGGKPVEFRMVDDPTWSVVIMPMILPVRGTTEDED